MTEPLACVDAEFGPGPCNGTVYEYDALSGSGFTYPRCEHHYETYRNRLQPTMDRWRDSEQPPHWFDPEYAGEVWDNPY
jgi:hypothetical protein